MTDFDQARLKSACAAIEKQGYVILENLISKEQAAALAESLAAAPRRVDAHKNFQFCFALLDHDMAFADIVAQPLILAMMHYFLGGRVEPAPNAFAWPVEDQIHMMEVAGIVAHPGAVAAVWHLDAPMGQLNPNRPVPDFPIGINVIWMLTDFTVENGATRVLPGSHLGRKRPPATVEPLEGEVHLCGSAGSAAVIPDITWHAASANRTDKDRAGLSCFYGPWWIGRLGTDWLPISSQTYERLPAEAKPLLKHQLSWNIDQLHEDLRKS